MSSLSHSYHFDPSYGHTLESLLEVPLPNEPEDFQSFWLARYQKALNIHPQMVLSKNNALHAHYQIIDIAYESTDGFRIGGWMLIPKSGQLRKGMVVGHGYGGRDGPDFDLPISDTVFLFPCFRGLSRSACHGVSSNPAYHVLHDIDKPDRYLLGGCVEDVWVGVTALLQLFPELEGHIGYQGTSFGGGIGSMSVAWDPRIQLAAFNVPSFGHQALRLGLATTGSGAAVSMYHRRHGNVMDTLQYYDAALSARHISIPVHVAAALFDPVVAPPGQFAVYNGLSGPKQLFVATAGHFDFPGREEQESKLLNELKTFFDPL